MRTGLSTTMTVSTTMRKLRQIVREDVLELVEKARTLIVFTREERKSAVQTFRYIRN